MKSNLITKLLPVLFIALALCGCAVINSPGGKVVLAVVETIIVDYAQTQGIPPAVTQTVLRDLNLVIANGGRLDAATINRIVSDPALAQLLIDALHNLKLGVTPKEAIAGAHVQALQMRR